MCVYSDTTLGRKKHPKNKQISARYDLCTRCLVDWYVVPGEVLFHAGPACDSMLFVVHGSIRSVLGVGCSTGSIMNYVGFFHCLTIKKKGF